MSAIKNFRMACPFTAFGGFPGWKLALPVRKRKVFGPLPPLSPRPRKFPVVFSLNPRHMRLWCCPAGSRGANRRARCGLGQFFKSWLRIGTTAAFPATWAAFPSRLSAMGPPHAARDADKTAPPPSILGAFLSLPFASHSGATRPLLPRCRPKGLSVVRAGMGQRPRG